MLRTWKFKDPIYGMGYILHCGDFDEAQAYLKRYVNKDPEPEDTHLSALTTLVDVGDRAFIHLWLRDYPRKIRTLGTLAHECLHATMMTLDMIGEKPDVDHDEPAAYYLAWLFEECHRRLIKL